MPFLQQKLEWKNEVWREVITEYKVWFFFFFSFFPFFMLANLIENQLIGVKTLFMSVSQNLRSASNNLGWLVGWLVGFLLHINLSWLFNAKYIFMQIVIFQTIQSSMSKQFNCQKHFYFKLFSLFKQF